MNILGQLSVETELALALAPTGREAREEEKAAQNFREYLDMLTEEDWQDFAP